MGTSREDFVERKTKNKNQKTSVIKKVTGLKKAENLFKTLINFSFRFSVCAVSVSLNYEIIFLFGTEDHR